MLLDRMNEAITSGIVETPWPIQGRTGVRETAPLLFRLQGTYGAYLSELSEL